MYCSVCKRKLHWYQRAADPMRRVIHTACTHRSYEDLEPSERLALPYFFVFKWRTYMLHRAEDEDSQDHRDNIDSIIGATQVGELTESLASSNSAIQETALVKMQELNVNPKYRKRQRRWEKQMKKEGVKWIL